MKPKPVTRRELQQVVRLLDKMSRVMATMKMRDDVLSFGQTQIVNRLYRLERRLPPPKARKGRAK